MEVSSTKCDGTDMALARIPENPVRTYPRTHCGAIIGGQDELAPSSRDLLHITRSLPLSLSSYLVPFRPLNRL